MLFLVPIGPSRSGDLAQMMDRYLSEVAPEADIDTEVMARRFTWPDSFWIATDDIIGFALTRFRSDGVRELSEFYINPAHRRAGLGLQAARRLIAQFPGPWEVGVVTNPRAAQAFWRKCLDGLPKLAKGPALTPFQCESYTFETNGA
jgi:predicted acetyltransferase